MRLNVYSQELLLDGAAETQPIIELVQQEADTGITYSAVRYYLHSSTRLHQPPQDDDRSAITFWLPKSKYRREYLASHFEELADLIRNAPEETGLD